MIQWTDVKSFAWRAPQYCYDSPSKNTTCSKTWTYLIWQNVTKKTFNRSTAVVISKGFEVHFCISLQNITAKFWQFEQSYRVAQKVSHYWESSLDRIKVRQDFSSILSIKWAQEYYNFVFCVTYKIIILLCSFYGTWHWSCNMGKINVYNKIVTGNQKRENMEI